MSRRVWHKGPPPHVGWWNASNGRVREVWRWWDGFAWSFPAVEGQTAKFAAKQISKPNNLYGEVEWTHRWPAGARVPRIDPVTGKVTGKGGAQ